jgi:O-antigen/teichoic acid export membrane protein
MTLLLGLPAALGLYLLAEPITVLLFQNAEAGAVLAMLSFSVVFLTLFQTTSGILQGLGRPVEPVKKPFLRSSCQDCTYLVFNLKPRFPYQRRSFGHCYRFWSGGTA